MSDEALLALLAALFGAVIGSFLNVCIVRWGAEPKQSVLHPRRSHCPKCGYEIRWYDNIPVVSWLLLLRGRCRGCSERISAMYPAVELLTALVWAYMAWRYGVTLEALRGAVFATLLLGITMTDARAYIIPDEFSLGGLALGLVLAGAGGIATGDWSGTVAAVIGAAVGFGILWLVGWLGAIALKQDAMGGGDIKMMAMVGAFVGWQGVLLTIFLGALLGTLVFLPMTLAGNRKLVPFGIFLGLGALVTFLAGPAIYEWYGAYVRGA